MRIYGYIMSLFLWLGTTNILGLPFQYIDFLSASLLVYLLVKKKEVRISKISFYLLLLFMSSFFPYFYVQGLSLEGIKYFIFLIITVISYENFTYDHKPYDILKFLISLISSFVTLTAMSLLVIILNNGLESITGIYQYKNSLILGFGGSNYIAAILTFIGVLSLGIYFSNYIFKLETLYISVICLLMVIVLNSRTAIICFIVGIVLNLISNNYKNIYIYTAVILIVLIIWYMYLKTNFISLLFIRFSTENGNISVRLNQFSHIFSAIKNFTVFELLFGRGYGSEKIYYGLLIHNLLLKLMYSFGIIGCFVYFRIFIKIFKNVNSPMRIAILTVFIGSMFEPILLTAFFDTIFFIITMTYMNFVKSLKKFGVNHM